MSEAVEKNVGAALDEAERLGACYAPDDRLLREAMRARADVIVEPVRGLFFRAGAWARLEPPERALHLMRALAPTHPGWRFCSASAAVAYGLPVTWDLLANVFVAAPSGASYPLLPRHRAPSPGGRRRPDGGRPSPRAVLADRVRLPGGL